MSELLQSESVETGSSPDACVIWLHGLGADGHDFVPIVPELGLPSSASVRFIFPHASVRPVTLNNGMSMRAWYDIISLDREGRADESGIRQSQASIELMIKQQIDAGITSDRIVIAGFSQGGAVALQVALRHADKLAGLLVMSSYLSLSESLEAELSAQNKTIPILMVHGTQDPVVTVGFGRESRDQLAEHGIDVDWREYPMAHQVCVEEIRDIGVWLERVLVLSD